MDKDIIICIIFRVLYAIGFVPIYFALSPLLHDPTPADEKNVWIFLGVALVYIVAVRFCEMQICENPKNN